MENQETLDEIAAGLCKDIGSTIIAVWDSNDKTIGDRQNRLNGIRRCLADRIKRATKIERRNLDALERACEEVLDAETLKAVIAAKRRIQDALAAPRESAREWEAVLKRSKCAVLSLVLERCWYDMIDRGEKREEYRDEGEYWNRRIRNWIGRRGIHVVEFRLGYKKDAPRMWFTAADVCFRTESHTYTWGEPTYPHFAIVLRERVKLEEDGK